MFPFICFKVNKRVSLPDGGGIGYVATACDSVEEVVFFHENLDIKHKNCSGHRQDKNGEHFSSGITLISGNVLDIISYLGRHQPPFNFVCC